MRMRCVISALILMMVLSTGALAEDCANCPDAWDGNSINQTNEQAAIAGSTPLIPGYIYVNGEVQEKAANWAVVAGDDNHLYQDNLQHGESAWLTAKANGTNIALIVGSGNEAHQKNYAPNFIITPLQLPGSLDLVTINQVNEVILMGDNNYADQSNREKSDLTTWFGSIDLDQTNFGLVLGDNNTLVQNNTDRAAFTNWLGKINQTQANAAYLYGFENLVNQKNKDYANIGMGPLSSSPYINQTAKNLAFAISSCCSPVFIPVCNNTSMEGECPQAPSTPPVAPDFPLTDYPLDP
jgi:hypothetical protein